MSANAGQFLSTFLSPAWLGLLPLTAIPLVTLFFRQKKLIPTTAGWGITTKQFIASRFSWRLWRALFVTLGILSIIMALAKPVWPEIQAIKPVRAAHHWAIVLDCSGSMAQTDPGQTFSRLKRLTDAVRNEIRQRPYDRFTIIRVAGFADRIGPPAANGEFLDQLLNEITPASPGEDGTSLADGLILAMDELVKHGETSKKTSSILLISDGRDNPPDPASQKLIDILSLFQNVAIPLHWLNLNLPIAPDESKESKELGKSSILLLNSMVRNSGGTIINIDQNVVWNAVIGNSLVKLAPIDGQLIPSATVLLLILSLVFFVIGIAINIMAIGFDHRFRFAILNQILLLLHFISIIFLFTVIYQFYQNQKTELIKESPCKYAKKAIAILIDVSPSMTAADTPDRNRLESAKRLAQAFAKEALLQQGCVISIHAFSGRALALTPWTTDYAAARSVITELEPRQIRPDGSDWSLLFQHIDQISQKLSIKNQANEFDINFMIITDGEFSKAPNTETTALISKKGIKFNCITLGSDREPGITFSVDDSRESLWIDKSTNNPARTKRHDRLSMNLTQLSGGKFFAIGTSSFDPYVIARDFISLNSTDTFNSPEKPKDTIILIKAALYLILASELIELFWQKKSSLKIILSMSLLITSFACRQNHPNERLWHTIHEARQLQLSGRLPEAERLLQRIKTSHVKNPLLHYHLGLIMLVEGEYENAISEFEKTNQLITINDKDQNLLLARSTYAIGYAKALQQNWQEALKNLELAMNSNAMNQPDLHNERYEIEKNIIFVRQKVSLAEHSNQNKAQTNSKYKESDSFESSEKTMKIELSERVSQARAKARVARQAFEKSGDQIMGPFPKFSGKPSIDW